MTQNKLTILGITGGIGSGKTEVLNAIREMPNTVVVEADKLAHQLMLPGTPVYDAVIQVFGEEIRGEDDKLDRIRLGSLVFSDPEKLETLNGIVHPAVKEAILSDIDRVRKSGDGTEIYCIEAALLIQDGYREICDEILYIHVPGELRINRLLASRGGTRRKWEDILRSQPEDAFFYENTDCCIENDGTIEELRAQLRHELNRIKKGGRKPVRIKDSVESSLDATADFR